MKLLTRIAAAAFAMALAGPFVQAQDSYSIYLDRVDLDLNPSERVWYFTLTVGSSTPAIDMAGDAINRHNNKGVEAFGTSPRFNWGTGQNLTIYLQPGTGNRTTITEFESIDVCRKIGWATYNTRLGKVRLGFASADPASPFMAQKTQVKIPRITRGGTATQPVIIETFVDGVAQGFKLYRAQPGGSERYVNFDNQGFSSLRQSSKDWRLTYESTAKLVFYEATFENRWTKGKRLGELAFDTDKPATSPTFKTLTSGGHRFDVAYWQAGCGQPFPMTYDKAVIGVMREIQGSQTARDHFGQTREEHLLETAGWFLQQGGADTTNFDVRYGNPADWPKSTVYGLELVRHTTQTSLIGYQVREPQATRTYETFAPEGSNRLTLMMSNRSPDPQDRIAIVGTEYRLLKGTTLLGTKTTGTSTPHSVLMLTGFVRRTQFAGDSNVVMTEAGKASRDAQVLGELYGKLVDIPFGEAR